MKCLFTVTGEDLNEVCKVIAETDAKIVGSNLGNASEDMLTYEVCGTFDEIKAARRLIRRLSRGKPRFNVEWGWSKKTTYEW